MEIYYNYTRNITRNPNLLSAYYKPDVTSVPLRYSTPLIKSLSCRDDITIQKKLKEAKQ